MDADEIKIALRGTALRNVTMDSLKETVRTAVVKAYGLKGLPLPIEAELGLMVDEIAGKVYRSYGFLTSQELFIIVEAGVTGEIGKDSRVTCASFFGWLSGYVASDLRKEVIRGLRQPSKPALYDLDTVKEMNRQAEVRGINHLWREYKEYGILLEGHIDGYCAMVYDAIIARWGFRFDGKVVDAARKKALAEMRRNGSTRTLKDGDLGTKVKKHLLSMCFQYCAKKGVDLSITN